MVHHLVIRKYDLDTNLDLVGFLKKKMAWRELEHNSMLISKVNGRGCGIYGVTKSKLTFPGISKEERTQIEVWENSQKREG